ncbi:hypothetical protein FOZ63_018436, partial [Perkinsus olseni]
LSMNTIGVLLVITTAVTSQPDWSGVNLEPPRGLETTGPPRGHIDWSSVSLEPPVTPTTVGGELDWSSITLEPPASLSDLSTNQGNVEAEHLLRPTPDNKINSQCPAALLWILLVIAIASLLGSIGQILLLRKLMATRFA